MPPHLLPGWKRLKDLVDLIVRGDRQDLPQEYRTIVKMGATPDAFDEEDDDNEDENHPAGGDQNMFNTQNTLPTS